MNTFSVSLSKTGKMNRILLSDPDFPISNHVHKSDKIKSDSGSRNKLKSLINLVGSSKE